MVELIRLRANRVASDYRLDRSLTKFMIGVHLSDAATCWTTPAGSPVGFRTFKDGRRFAPDRTYLLQTGRCWMAVHAAEAHDIETQLAEAAEATEALARQVFGPTAYLRRGFHGNPETGEELPTFEVHYCFENWEEDFERLESLHNQFLDAYIRIVGPALRSRIALKPIPTDGD